MLAPHTAASLNYHCLNYLDYDYHYYHHYPDYNYHYQQILSWIIRNYSDLTDYTNYVLAPHTAASLNYHCLDYLNYDYHYYHHYLDYNYHYQQILSWIIRNYSDLTDYTNYVLAPHTAAYLN